MRTNATRRIQIASRQLLDLSYSESRGPVTMNDDHAAGGWRSSLPPITEPQRRGVSVQGVWTFLVSAVVGIAIWWPTQAMEPRYDYNHLSHHVGWRWYVPLMFAAALPLTMVFSRQWKWIGAGLVALQLVAAPFTTPRGDNDGLWVLVFPLIVVLGAALTLYCAMLSVVVRRFKRRAVSERR